MNNYILSIVMLLTISMSFGVKAQTNTQSPYSKLGLGDFQSLGFGRSAAMGGVGYSLYSGSELNNLNPASLANLDSLLSIFEIGLHANRTHSENTSAADNRLTANLTNVSYGMAVSKGWGMGFGLTPFTSVGYSISVNKQISGKPEYYSITLEGNGGLSNFYWSNGFKLTPNITIGLNTSFIFGPKNEVQYLNLEGQSDYTLTRTLSEKYHGWKFDLGYQQTIPLNKNNKLVIGWVVNAPGKLKRKTSELVIQNHPLLSSDDTLRNDEDVKSNLNFSINYGGGISYMFKENLNLATEYTFNRYSKLEFSDNFSNLIDNHIFAMGLEYLPLKSRIIKTPIKYRMGANYQTGYYSIEGNKLKSLNLTAGIGFPIRSVNFSIYTSYETRGFLTNNYIKENIFSFGINLSFKDLWFHKRQFN